MSTTFQKEDLISLYSSGKSMFEISMMLNCSVHKIAYWMDKYEIKRRSMSDAIYVKWNPNGDPFSIVKLKNKNNALLFGLGLGIYWGEGEKASHHSVRVANTDPAVILMFRRFLMNICSVKKEKISYSIVCFNDSNPEAVKEYWAKILMISPDKFGKIVQIPPQGKGKYKRKSQNGVCTITISNIKLKAWIMNELKKLNINADVAQW